ncbi:MAG: DUF4974 domain-containing protein [Cytophagales bacterium]|nr:DUF4974 domain-containing protein [Cytophagales bacterium]
MNKKRFFELVTKSQTEPLNKRERKELDSIIASNPEFEADADFIKRFWEETRFSMTADGDQVYAQISNEINDHTVIQIDSLEKGGKTRRFNPSRIAASIVFFLLAGFITIVILQRLRLENTEEVAEHEIDQIEKYIPSGQKLRIYLPDGSIVWLNSESTLKYPEVFSDQIRPVELEGEAFFEIARNPDKPFVLKSGNVSTTALGTSFNVRSYASENNIEVTLATGSVLVEIQQQEHQKFILEPGYSVNYKKRNREASKQKSDVDKHINWKDGVLQFEEDGFETVFKKLSRWYGVEFEFSKTYLGDEWKYSGWFKNDYLDNVLESISFTQDFEYEINNKKVTITIKN